MQMEAESWKEKYTKSQEEIKQLKAKLRQYQQKDVHSVEDMPMQSTHYQTSSSNGHARMNFQGLYIRI